MTPTQQKPKKKDQTMPKNKKKRGGISKGNEERTIKNEEKRPETASAEIEVGDSQNNM